ncbi:MAG: hypothetical protein OEZ36_00715 [Spirochaetota bacterium]|nr:hypothetical protein [Spirochaetota bacterium]
MAILLEGPDGAPVIWGKLGDYVIQRTRLGKMSIRRYKKPANPRTLAQQNNREAMREAVSRWRDHEKSVRKSFWDTQAVNSGFRDGYRAFLSSFMLVYQQKRVELGDHIQALSFVMDIKTLISPQESAIKANQDRKSRDLITGVLSYHRSGEYFNLLRLSLDYLKLRGWHQGRRYGLLPYIDEFSEAVVMGFGLIISPGS